MTSNVTKLKIPRKMSKRTGQTAQGSGQILELPLGDTDNLTPQQLLAKLSRDESITEVMVVFAKPSIDEDNVEDTMVYSANMAPNRINWLLDKVKLWLMGIQI